MSNRLEKIKKATETDEWNFDPSKNNPAIHKTRGLAPWNTEIQTSAVGAVTRTKNNINQACSWPALLFNME